MIKRIFLVCFFILVFVLCAGVVYYMQNPVKVESKNPDIMVKNEVQNSVDAESMHTYNLENLEAGCSVSDKVFCAVERTVKCTISPTLDDCDKDLVPGFVLGQTEDTERPTEISFKFSKIKPVFDSSDISVYTQSDCNAMWFGLCKGTVVYSLSPKDNGEWAVTNIFALE